MIIGNGYIGKRLSTTLDNAVLAPTKVFSERDAVKLIDYYSEEEAVKVLINAAGKTHGDDIPNIDWCEAHMPETLMSNVLLPLHLLRACHDKDIMFVHLGSGCIYDNFLGDSYDKELSWSEGDAPNFTGSYYSRTKAQVEAILNEFDCLQLRLRMPLDIYPGPRNLIDKLKGFDKLIDIPNSITSIPHFITTLRTLVDRRRTGIYNITCKGGITHPEIMRLYDKAMGTKSEFEVIDPDELGKLVLARRSNCILSTDKLEAEGVEVPLAERAVWECLVEYKKNLKNK